MQQLKEEAMAEACIAVLKPSKLDDSLAVVGGTAWMLCKEELADQFDLLVVDEGQMPLANLLVMATLRPLDSFGRRSAATSAAFPSRSPGRFGPELSGVLDARRSRGAGRSRRVSTHKLANGAEPHSDGGRAVLRRPPASPHREIARTAFLGALLVRALMGSQTSGKAWCLKRWSTSEGACMLQRDRSD